MDAVNQPLLDVRDLSVAFRHQGGSSVAVDRISFDIKRGECVALVGESGSGKSVSALSVLKLLPYPTASHPSGSIRFKGQELLSMSESQIRGIRGNDISIIFQEPMTSLDYLGFGLPPGSPSLGELLSQGTDNLQAPWLALTGFFTISIMLSLLIFVGEAARDAFDPRKTFS